MPEGVYHKLLACCLCTPPPPPSFVYDCKQKAVDLLIPDRVCIKQWIYFFLTEYAYVGEK